MYYAGNYKNLLNFVKVMPKILVVPFFPDTVYNENVLKNYTVSGKKTPKVICTLLWQIQMRCVMFGKQVVNVMPNCVPIHLSGLEMGWNAIPALAWLAWNHTATSFLQNTILVCCRANTGHNVCKYSDVCDDQGQRQLTTPPSGTVSYPRA